MDDRTAANIASGPEQGDPVLNDLLARARRVINSSAFCRDLGVEILDCGEGYAVGRILLNSKHGNPLGDVHGGVPYALADSICGIAAGTRGTGGATVSGFMDYLRPVHCRELICNARVVKYGSNLNRAEGILTNEDGKELAKAYFVYLASKEYRDFRADDLAVHKEFT